MPRPEKVQAVAEIKERIEGARAVFLAEYAGLSVKEQQALRRELRANGAEFKVVKMTLARRAADDLEIDSLDDLLLGPTGITFADEDAVSAARVLKGFAKDHDVFVIKGGLLGLEFLTPEKISELAEIEPREVLLAKLAGAMKAPMANLAGLLAALPRNTASVLQQLLEKKEAEGPSVEESQPAAEDSTDGESEASEADAAPEEAPEEDAAPEAADAADDSVEEADDAPAEDSDSDEGEPESDATEGDDSAPAEAEAVEASDDADADDEDDQASADADAEEK